MSVLHQCVKAFWLTSYWKFAAFHQPRCIYVCLFLHYREEEEAEDEKKNWQTHWMPFFISYKFFSKLLQYWLVYFACNVRDSLQFQRICSLFALKSHRANNHTHTDTGTATNIFYANALFPFNRNEFFAIALSASIVRLVVQLNITKWWCWSCGIYLIAILCKYHLSMEMIEYTHFFLFAVGLSVANVCFYLLLIRAHTIWLYLIWNGWMY